MSKHVLRIVEYVNEDNNFKCFYGTNCKKAENKEKRDSNKYEVRDIVDNCFKRMFSKIIKKIKPFGIMMNFMYWPEHFYMMKKVVGDKKREVFRQQVNESDKNFWPNSCQRYFFSRKKVKRAGKFESKIAGGPNIDKIKYEVDYKLDLKNIET